MSGELVHVIADAHIYDRHIPLVEELIQRPVHDAPKFALNPEIKDFYDFTPEDVTCDRLCDRSSDKKYSGSSIIAAQKEKTP